MNLRNLIYQNLHFQKSESENDLKTARLRQLEVEAKAQERDAKASLATIGFEKCDLPAPMRLGRDTAPNEQPELMPDTGAKPKRASIKPNSNELAFSGLLKEPPNKKNRKDAWFEVIDEMTKEFYINNQNTMPSKVQARAALWKDSPKHGITVNGDNLKMIGVPKPLNPRSFNRRWNQYTGMSTRTKLSKIKPN